MRGRPRAMLRASPPSFDTSYVNGRPSSWLGLLPCPARSRMKNTHESFSGKRRRRRAGALLHRQLSSLEVQWP